MANLTEVVKQTVNKYSADASMLLDIIRDVQDDQGYVSDQAISEIAKELNLSLVDVEGVVTFYHFFSKDPLGKYAVYLNNSAVANMKGRASVATAFEREVGAPFGKMSSDGLIGLYDTSCIGMNDQEPAAIINGKVFTNIDEDRVKQLVSGMKAGKDVDQMVSDYGDGQNQSELIRAMVNNNIMKKGAVLFAPFKTGSAIQKAVQMTPDEVVEEIKKSNLRGRGGAGFPTGIKWDSTRKAPGDKKYIVCNADEGEPGTFKDRVVLTEIPRMLFEGMAVAGYAIGSEQGILYLRAEYAYLKDYLESIINELRDRKILGNDIGGKSGFSFDIKIKLGAGAYVCGEESALIESAEGKRGQPRNRPPFPAQCGFKNMPTSINNVESFCSAARIIVEGSSWFNSMGTAQSKGTKLLSVSGDCTRPGIYEIEFGMTVKTLLEEVGGRNAFAVQVGGPSGTCVSKSDFSKRICYDELATGGSIIVIGPDTDLLQVVHNFMDFFVDESCGWCVPCRAGNVIVRNKLEKIMHGNGTEKDLNELEQWCLIVKNMSRCGLGAASTNPILTTLGSFRSLYEEKLQKNTDYVSEFDLAAAVKDSCIAAGRKPNLEGH